MRCNGGRGTRAASRYMNSSGLITRWVVPSRHGVLSCWGDTNAASRDAAWLRIGRKMPKRVGDIGFSMVVHPHDADTAWVFPMDDQTVWPRTSPDGRPVLYVTRNAGRRGRRHDQVLPTEQAWWTVKR